MEVKRSKEGCVALGPWGGPKGNKWSFDVNGGITKIVVVHGGAIDSLLFKSIDEEGLIRYSPKFGGNGGDHTDKIDIDWPNEYLTAISGTIGVFITTEPPIIRSLCFHTNLTKYGPFGSKTGTSFSIPIEGAVVVGFHGRSGWFLDAIGVYIKPIISSSSHVVACKRYPKEEKEKMMDVMNVVVSPGSGPWGGHGGKPWDDGVFSAIKQVHVYVVNGLVQSVQFLYEKRDGSSVSSPRHGSAIAKKDCCAVDDDTINRISLDCDGEYFVGIAGYYSMINGSDGFEAVRSLTFYSNKGKYGPFGNEIGQFFASPTGGKVVGFHGKCSMYLDAIGVHAEYF